MITCSSCGAQSDDYAQVCSSCGVHIWNASGPATGRVPDASRPVVTPNPPQWPAYSPPVQQQAYAPPQQQYLGQPRHMVGFRCPYCQTMQPPYTMQKISTAGWVMFILLFLFCFPLFWIGLLMKEDYRQCSSCGMKLG